MRCVELVGGVVVAVSMASYSCVAADGGHGNPVAMHARHMSLRFSRCVSRGRHRTSTRVSTGFSQGGSVNVVAAHWIELRRVAHIQLHVAGGRAGRRDSDCAGCSMLLVVRICVLSL